MFDEYGAPQKGPYPESEKEVEELVANVVKFVHSDAVSQSIVEALKGGQSKPIESIAYLAAPMAVKVVQTIEKDTGRDIPGETELGVLSIVVEELFTISANMGLQVSEDMVANAVQISTGLYNKLISPQPQGPQGQPQQPQGQMQGPQGQPQQPQGQMQGPQQGQGMQGQQMAQQGPPQGLMGGM